MFETKGKAYPTIPQTTTPTYSYESWSHWNGPADPCAPCNIVTDIPFYRVKEITVTVLDDSRKANSLPVIVKCLTETDPSKWLYFINSATMHVDIGCDSNFVYSTGVEGYEQAEEVAINTMIEIPDGPTYYASSTPIQVRDYTLYFSISILIVMGFLMVSGFIFNSLSRKDKSII